ncbi:MAG TPA: hypothetical protein VI643_05035, partial [Planctomycetota bacterium]|nr:hypothetical protein [Planctomycetota bacterium]
GSADITATAASVTASSFGSGANPIGTAVSDLTVDTSASNGNQFISNGGDLTALRLNAGTGMISLSATGALTDSDGSVDVVASSLAISAGGDIGLDTQLGSLQAASGGSISIANTGALVLSDLGAGYAIDNAAGDVTIDATGALTVGADINNGGFRTTLIAGGAIDQTGGTITAAELVTSSTGGTTLGSTAVASLQATNAGGGAIRVANAGSLLLTDLTFLGYAVSNPAGGISISTSLELSMEAPMTAGGSVSLTAGMALVQTGTGEVTSGGDVTFLAGTDISLRLVDATGGVSLTATGGSIIDNNDGVVPETLNVQAGANSTMSAGGTIGVGDCIEVNVAGTVTVSAGSQVAGVSVDLCGTVTPSNSLIISGAPPGTVLFNGVDQAALALLGSLLLPDHVPKAINPYLHGVVDHGLFVTPDLLKIQE